ncbi:MAG TPA: hypothetical protein VF147_00310 [Vicinamibacterales bacterium]
MKLRYVLLVVGLPLLALGAEGLYNGARGRRQATMTCEEFVRSRPKDLWLRLTACDLDYESPGYREVNGHIAEVFFPVRAAGQARNTAAPLLASTTDPDALAIVQGTLASGTQASQEAVTVMMLRLVTYLRASREVEGLARAGVVETLQTRRSLQSFPVPLDPNYVVIDLHARPKYVIPGVEAGVGLISLLLFLLTGRRRREPEAVPLESASVENAEMPAAAPAPLPAMLLLNLDASAGVETIEHAPPLGTREETIAALERALNGLRFDEGGRATVSRPDYTMEIDIGEQDPVWTATLRASGDGASSAIAALADTTGWRVYVPKRGMFLGASEGIE